MQKILIVQLRQLGDILLTTPHLRAVRKAFPKAQIDFLSHDMGKLILKNNPYLTSHITYNEKQTLLSSLKLMGFLRRQRYDLVIDFMYNPRSALLSAATAAKRRVAFPSRRNWFYTDIILQPKESIYIVKEKFELTNSVGIENAGIGLDLPFEKKDARVFLDFVSENQIKLDTDLLVCLSPTHRRVERIWPEQRYAELADQLTSLGRFKIVWLWGPGEKDFVERARSLMKSSSFLAPRTSFSELAAFIANCDYFIGNSNGPSHVAVAGDTPSLQLHGPTIAKTWCPNDERHRSIQKASMDDITTEEVLQSFTALSTDIENKVGQKHEKGVRMHWQD